MADISTNLEKIIANLDNQIDAGSAPAHDYGMDIASKIDHISKQLEAIQSGGSGAGSLCVTYTYDGDQQEITACDKTIDEILEAVSSGVNVFAKIDLGYSISVFQLVEVISNTTVKRVGFSSVSTDVEGGVLHIGAISIVDETVLATSTRSFSMEYGGGTVTPSM